MVQMLLCSSAYALSIEGSFPDKMVGETYSLLDGTLSAKDYYGTKCEYSVVNGSLPPGLKLSSVGISSCALAGMATQTGTYTFTIKVTDKMLSGTSPTATKTFTITISDNPDVVAIREANFPDETFRTYVRNTFDEDVDGYLRKNEIAKVTEINVRGEDITSLKGVEHFTALTELICDFNQLTAIDVSKNSALQTLCCSGNQLTTLDVSSNSDLQVLECANNQLTALNLSKNSALTYLTCINNQLNALDMSKNTALTELWCHDNQLTALDVSKNTALTALSCFNNRLTTLDVSKNTALLLLWCNGNQLTTLDVSKNTALLYLWCNDNQLTTLDVSKNSDIEELVCSGNQLTTLDVSKNSFLLRLYCSENSLTSLKLGNNSVLDVLECAHNNLSSLDISDCPKLLEVSSTLEHDDNLKVITEKAVAPTITTTSLADGYVGVSYSATLSATGTDTITWIVSGLPSGLSCLSAGEISGIPAVSGTFNITVTATNYAGSATKFLQLSIIGGGGTETPEAEEEFVPKFKAHQPVLEGQIIVNFFALLPAGVDYSNSYVKFDVLRDTTYNPAQEYDPSFTTEGKSGTYYGFRCCLTSIQMADPITATLHYGNGRTVTHTYKLTDYLDKYYAASTTPEALRNIVGAMKDYGHYAQIALAEANGWTLGTTHLTTEAANVYTASDVEEARQAVEKYAKSWDVGNSGIQSIGYRLVLDSDTALELFIRPASGYSGKVCAYSRGAIGITDTNANLAVKQSDGRYLVQISGISAHQLDYMNTIQVVTDRGEFDVKVSALSYVDTILNSDKYNDNMKKAVTSLYRYYKATKEYRESTGQ